MRKARFKETQIVRALKEVEGGRQVKEVSVGVKLVDTSLCNIMLPFSPLPPPVSRSVG